MKKAIFYHAGCPVCISAEQQVLEALDKQRFEIEIVHLGENSERISEAENFGIKSVPALMLDSSVFHINFGIVNKRILKLIKQFLLKDMPSFKWKAVLYPFS